MDRARATLVQAAENGYVLSDLSKALGKNHAYLQQFLKRGIPKRLPEEVRAELAEMLGVSESSLKPEGPESRVAPKKAAVGPKIIPGDELVGDRDFPVYGATQGGAEGHLVFSAAPIQWVRRPFFLIGIPTAYGVRVDGDSMVPAFRPNDIAIVNPTLQPEPDTDVVLLDTDHRLAEAESIIKHLVNFNDRNWRLQQFKPEKVWNEPKVDWPICHRVVGKYDRRR